MNTYNFDSLPRFSDKTALTIGNFDGVHLGHKHQIEKFIAICMENNFIPTLLTFAPHPSFLINPDQKNFSIVPTKKRNEFLKGLGVVEILEINFDVKLRSMKAEEFLEQLISARNVSALFVGPDFNIGMEQSDSIALAREICLKSNTIFSQGEMFEIDQKRVSSSLIRSLVKDGEVVRVQRYLGRPFSIWGEVIHGKGKGESIGFATANIEYQEKMLYPPNGVYACWCIYGDMVFKSAVNIGRAPTLGGLEHIAIEVHLIDQKLEIYGEEIEIQFIGRVRDETKFKSIDDLKKQISSDVKVIQGILID